MAGQGEPLTDEPKELVRDRLASLVADDVADETEHDREPGSLSAIALPPRADMAMPSERRDLRARELVRDRLASLDADAVVAEVELE